MTKDKKQIMMIQIREERKKRMDKFLETNKTKRRSAFVHIGMILIGMIQRPTLFYARKAKRKNT